MKKLVIALSTILTLIVAATAVGILAAEKLAAPSPTTPNMNRPAATGFEECMRITGAIEENSFAPTDSCVMDGKTYYSDEILSGVTSGASDLASCLKKVNSSEANEAILEQARQACYEKYR